MNIVSLSHCCHKLQHADYAPMSSACSHTINRHTSTARLINHKSLWDNKVRLTFNFVCSAQNLFRIMSMKRKAKLRKATLSTPLTVFWPPPGKSLYQSSWCDCQVSMKWSARTPSMSMARRTWSHVKKCQNTTNWTVPALVTEGQNLRRGDSVAFQIRTRHQCSQTELEWQWRSTRKQQESQLKSNTTVQVKKLKRAIVGSAAKVERNKRVVSLVYTMQRSQRRN